MISVHCTLCGILKATSRLLIAVRLASFANPFMAWYIFNKKLGVFFLFVWIGLQPVLHQQVYHGIFTEVSTCKVLHL
jgi:hypothetical protein